MCTVCVCVCVGYVICVIMHLSTYRVLSTICTRPTTWCKLTKIQQNIAEFIHNFCKAFSWLFAFNLLEFISIYLAYLFSCIFLSNFVEVPWVAFAFAFVCPFFHITYKYVKHLYTAYIYKYIYYISV